MVKRESRKAKPLGPVSFTARGFELIEFADRYGVKCELQQSSMAEYAEPGTSAVWLGPVGDNPPDLSTLGTSYGTRMHLDRKQVLALIGHLSQWLKSGSFAKGKEK